MKTKFIFGLLVCLGLSACGAPESPSEAALAATSTPTIIPTASATPTAVPTATETAVPTDTPTPEPTPTSTPLLWATATAEYNELSIRAMFEQLRTAIANDDFEGALEFISSIDFERYDYLLADALALELDEIDTLELSEKFIVLWLRHIYSRAEIEKLSGEDVVIASFERGWINLSFLENLEISEIDIGITPGNAIVSFEGMPPSAGLFLIREGGRHWKVFLGQFSWQNEELEQLLRESGLPEDEFFIELIEVLSEKPVDERIFDGPIE